MPRRFRLAAIVSLAVLLVAVAAVVGVREWRSAHRTTLQQALALAPGDAARFSFTDWAGVRREVGADLDASSTPTKVDDFLGTAFDRDLSSTSALLDSTGVLQSKYGFSPATVSWELFSQGKDGAAVLLQLPDGADMGDVADSLDDLGYERPSRETGVWLGGGDLIARISDGAGLTPELQYVALVPDQHLVVSSDTAAYARIAVAAATGGGATISGVDGVDGVAAAAGDALSAAVYTGDDACRELAMSQADDSDQADAEQLVAEAGTVSPLTGFAMSALADGTVRVALGFADDDQARANADSRARLARGPAVGQGGDFADRFTLTRAAADGRVVTLELRPAPDTFVLSDLSTGPVLYATC